MILGRLKRIAISTLTAIFSIAVIVFVVYQIYRYFYFPYLTELALYYTEQEIISANGVIFKDETIVTAEGTGVVSYLLGDGSKVSSGSVVAELYSSEQGVLGKLKVQYYDEEIDMLKRASNPGTGMYAGNEQYNKQISQSLISIITASKSGRLTDFDALRREYVFSLNKKQISTGVAKSFDPLIGELSGLKEGIGSSEQWLLEEVTAPSAGYFTSIVDRYEGLLTTENMKKYSAQELMAIPLSVGDAKLPGEIGKVMSGFEWYMAVSVPGSEIKRFNKGLTLSVSFQQTGINDIPMTVESTVFREGEPFGIVYLKCTYMSPELSRIRVNRADISFRSYTGLRVSAGSLRFRDGEAGVYVSLGRTIVFKRIDPILENGDYILSREHPEDTSYLQLFDEIVLEGKELYDGKPID